MCKWSEVLGEEDLVSVTRAAKGQRHWALFPQLVDMGMGKPEGNGKDEGGAGECK